LEIDVDIVGMNPNLPLPKKLSNNANQILKVFENRSIPRFDSQVWLESFRSDPNIFNELQVITSKCDNQISRGNIRYYAQEAFNGSQKELTRFFLATMIWGYNNDEENGVVNTRLSLNDTQLYPVLRNTIINIENQQVKVAYDDFKVKGCGPAFFTKIFYFIGDICKTKPLPLILDRNVARFIHGICIEEGWNPDVFIKTSRNFYVKAYSEGYIRYINIMDSWAKMLCCNADNIEYFMFQEGRY
jgi:hypothetical protein